MSKKSDELKFIKTIKTPNNPRDAYYQNEEDMTKYYYALILIGIIMVGFMLLT